MFKRIHTPEHYALGNVHDIDLQNASFAFLMLSKEGFILLVTAHKKTFGDCSQKLPNAQDPKSLVQAMVCKEATVFRQQLSRALADVLHRWLMITFGWDHEIARPYGSQVKVVNAQNPREMALSSESPVFFFQVALQDRRVKVIIYRILNAVRRDPILTLRFCWSSVVIFVTASALACHRLLVSWSEIFITNLSSAPWRIAVKESACTQEITNKHVALSKGRHLPYLYIFPSLHAAHELSTMPAVGVLALQGSFNEHIAGVFIFFSLFLSSRISWVDFFLSISTLSVAALRRIGLNGVEVRKAEQLENLSGLIIPGGESTTMAKLANYHNLFPALRNFVKTGRPVWGTCAGLIFLADRAVGQKSGGQELVGGLDCTVHRNFFGSQLQSFETELLVPELAGKEGGPTNFRGVFIRAPAILEVGPDVEVLADYSVVMDESMSQRSPFKSQEVCFFDLMKEKMFSEEKVIVAVKQRNLLGTAFHPELTSDTRWHSFFLRMVSEVGDTSLSHAPTSGGNAFGHPRRWPIDVEILGIHRGEKHFYVEEKQWYIDNFERELVIDFLPENVYSAMVLEWSEISYGLCS
ncbi:hypothetical protein ACLOJK_009335 [Asimina triloba]